MLHHGYMELSQLRYVVALAETRNFTRAAERCHVVQSALSHQIKAIEKELGTVLFARNSRRVEVTAAGQRFLVHAREALAAIEKAETEATAGYVTGQLRLGLIPTIMSLDVPELLGKYHRTYPEVTISLRGGVSEDLIHGLTAREIDVAFLGRSEQTAVPRDVRTLELSRIRHVVAVSSQHRYAGRKRLKLQELANEPFADLPTDSAARSQSDLAFSNQQLTRSVVFESDSPDLICGLVEQNLAVALLPPSFLKNRPELIAIPVEHGPIRIEYLAWNDFNPTSAAAAFLNLIDAMDG